MNLLPSRSSFFGRRPQHITSILGAVSLALSACVSVNSMKPYTTVDGLKRIPSKQIDVVYTAPDMSLAGYRRVMLDIVDVGVKNGWQSAHPQVSVADIVRIRDETARLFRQVFARELSARGGYSIVEEVAPDVLQVRASILDLDIDVRKNEPDKTPSRFVLTSDRLTLVAELRDSVSGAILVRAADRERGRSIGDLQIASDVSGSADAARAFAMWAGLLREALDAARAPPAASPQR